MVFFGYSRLCRHGKVPDGYKSVPAWLVPVSAKIVAHKFYLPVAEHKLLWLKGTKLQEVVCVAESFLNTGVMQEHVIDTLALAGGITQTLVEPFCVRASG